MPSSVVSVIPVLSALFLAVKCRRVDDIMHRDAELVFQPARESMDKPALVVERQFGRQRGAEFTSDTRIAPGLARFSSVPQFCSTRRPVCEALGEQSRHPGVAVDLAGSQVSHLGSSSIGGSRNRRAPIGAGDYKKWTMACWMYHRKEDRAPGGSSHKKSPRQARCKLQFA